MLETRLPPTRPGRHKKPAEPLSKASVNQIAHRILSTDYSNLRSVVLETLYEFVTLTETSLFSLVSETIAISPNQASFSRTLRRYIADGLITPLPYDALKKARRAGLPRPSSGQLKAYSLGPVGEEYARRKGWSGEGPMPALNTEHLAHDLLCAEAMLRMKALWLTSESPGVAEVRGPRGLSVWNPEKKAYLVAPDGLIIKHSLKGEFVRAFVVEYHNVSAMIQVQQKIKRYEEIAQAKYRWLWADAWGLEEMPYVMVLYRQEATRQHYDEILDSKGRTNANYAHTSLADLWAGTLSIMRFA